MQILCQKEQKKKVNIKKEIKPRSHVARTTIRGIPACVQRNSGDLYCYATIKYKNGKSSNAKGENDSESAQKTIQTFREFGLYALANAGSNYNSNPSGQCAEPHAVAEALKRGKEKSKSRTIKKIYVSEAYFSTRCKTRVAEKVRYNELDTGQKSDITDINFAKAILGYMPRDREDARKIIFSSHTRSYPRCKCCQEWVPGKEVLRKYVIADSGGR